MHTNINLSKSNIQSIDMLRYFYRFLSLNICVMFQKTIIDFIVFKRIVFLQYRTKKTTQFTQTSSICHSIHSYLTSNFNDTTLFFENPIFVSQIFILLLRITTSKCEIQKTKFKNHTRDQMYKSKYRRHSYLNYCWQRKRIYFASHSLSVLFLKYF